MNIMKKPAMNAVVLSSALLLAVSFSGTGTVFAQENTGQAADRNEEQISERRAAMEERMQERRAEAEARREERRAEFREANPELAAELDALRAEREAEREQQRAEFAAKYPNLAAAMEDGRMAGLGFRGDRERFTEGFERGRAFDRNRSGQDRGPRGERSREPRP